jgi:hypothetical protein
MTRPNDIKPPYNIIMEIDPALAAKWLEGNTHNRKLEQRVADDYAREILAGRWRLTHQGIAFDGKGVLIDGQHRLWAVVLSEKTVKMRVFFNEPAENMQAVDTGKRRSNFDVLRLTGEAGEVTISHLAALRAMITGDSPSVLWMTAGEESQLLSKHHEALDFAMRRLDYSRHKGIATASIRGVVARAYYSTDHDRLARFCDILKTGIPSEESDAPAVILRDFLMGIIRAGKGRSVRRICYLKAERALLAFLKYECITQLRPATSELFPLPEEVIEEAAA